MAFTTHDNAPYLYRKSGGGGDKEIDKLVGGTIAWNQLWTAPSLNVATKTEVDGVITITPKDYTTNSAGLFIRNMVYNHKVLLSAEVYPDGESDFTFEFGRAGISTTRIAPPNVWTRLTSVSMNSTSQDTILSCNIYGRFAISGWSSGTFKVRNIFEIDLTLMFGSTIADYVYSLEQSSQGSGLAWLRSYGFFTEDYYDYNAGELKSVSNLVSHDMTGFNQWDEEWELGGINSTTGINSSNTNQIRSKNYIELLPNTQYYFHVGQTGGGSSNWQSRFYDAEKNYIGVGGTMLYNAEFTPPSNARYVRFAMQTAYGTTYNNDICINISSSRNGEYEPYTLHSYPLGDVTLRGLPELNGNALYYDGDTYESNGTVTRKYGIVDLGSLTWGYRAADSSKPYPQEYATLSGAVSGISTNVVCPKYSASQEPVLGRTVDKTICTFNGAVYVSDSSYSTATEFKTAMNGVYLVYELASSTTETADTYTNPQWVDPNGTEKYTLSTNAFPMPVGHDTTYNTDIGSKTVNTQVNLSMTEPQVRQVYAKEGDTARVLNIHLDQTEEDGTLRILRPDGTEVTADAVLVPDFYDGLMAEIPSDATSIVGKCYCDVEQNGVSSMPFTLNVKKNERES